jgi:hypothetical protein
MYAVLKGGHCTVEDAALRIWCRVDILKMEAASSSKISAVHVYRALYHTRLQFSFCRITARTTNFMQQLTNVLERVPLFPQ